MSPNPLDPRRTAAGLIAALLLSLAASPWVQAQDTAAPPAPPETALTPHTYEKLGCKIDLPTAWKETVQEDRVRFEVDAVGGSGLLRVWRTRKSLSAIIKGLKARAEKEGWTTEKAEKVRAGEAGTRDAFFMIADAQVPATNGKKEATVRNLFYVFDAPKATYLLHVGTLRANFDDALLEKACQSLRLIETPAGEGAEEETPETPAPDAAPPKSDGDPGDD